MTEIWPTENKYEWWDNVSSTEEGEQTHKYVGYEASVNHVERFLESNAPIDGLLGRLSPAAHHEL